MQYTFKYKFVRIAPRKIRLLTNLVKNLSPQEAMEQLKFSNKSASVPVYELIKSAMSSMKEKNILPESVKIKSLTCDGASMLKRRIYKSRGRAAMIRKRSSHINLTIQVKENNTKNKLLAKKVQNGTKSKSKKSKTNSK
jgi:large subunit ribosomal protein L22